MTAFESFALIRFPTSEDLRQVDKSRQRELIARQTAEYLAKGGVIEQVPYGESAERHYPIKRTRQAQINFLRGKDFRRAQRLRAGRGENDGRE